MTQNKKHKQTLESAQYGLEISFKVILLELFLDHFLLLKSQGGVEVANPVTQILLTWTAQATLLAFSSYTETSIT